MKTTIFRIEGMSCDGCANTVKNAIEKEAGVQSVAVSFADKQARVTFDPQAGGEDRLAAAIEKPGFRVIGREAA
jgi:copper chaperone